MPRAPMAQQQVSNAPLPGPRLGAAPSPESYGAGLGDTLIRLGSDMYKKEVEIADRAVALEADREAAELQLDIQNRASQVQGKNVLGLDEQVKKEWDEGIDKIRTRLAGNDRVLSVFERRASERSLQLREFSLRHTNQQINQFYDQDAESGISSALNLIRANPDSPITFKNETQHMKSIIAAQAIRKGWAGTVTNEMAAQPSFYQRYIDRGEEPPKPGQTFFTEKFHQVQAQALSAAHREVITALNDQGKDLAADEYFKAHKDKLTAKDRDAIEPTLQEGSTRGEAQRLVRGLLAEGKTEAEILAHIDSKVDHPKIVDLAHTLVNRHFREQAAIKKETDDKHYLDAVNELEAFHKMLPNEPVEPRMIIVPSRWESFTLAERNALEARAKALTRYEKPDRPNDDALWLDFLALKPEEVATLSRREFDERYWSKFDNHTRQRAEQQWNTYKDALARKDDKVVDPKITASLTFKDQVNNAWDLSGLGKLTIDREKWTEFDRKTFVRFEDQAARALQAYEMSKLEGKRHATPDEVREVIAHVTKQAVSKVFLPGTVYGYNERSAITLDQDEQQRAIVPLEKIPKDSLEDLRRIFLSVRTSQEYVAKHGKAGAPATADELRRAYAQFVLGNRQAFDAIVNK